MRTRTERIKFHIANILDRYDGFCWASLCSWALGTSSLRECFTDKACCHDSDTSKIESCYCGKFRNGIRFEQDIGEIGR